MFRRNKHMSMTYTFGQTITTAGVTGPIFNALYNPTASPVTGTATPVRNQDNDTISFRINAGEILPIKVRQVTPSANIIGLL